MGSRRWQGARGLRGQTGRRGCCPPVAPGGWAACMHACNTPRRRHRCGSDGGGGEPHALPQHLVPLPAPRRRTHTHTHPTMGLRNVLEEREEAGRAGGSDYLVRDAVLAERRKGAAGGCATDACGQRQTLCPPADQRASACAACTAKSARCDGHGRRSAQMQTCSRMRTRRAICVDQGPSNPIWRAYGESDSG